jgi:hypothetical protein
MHREVSDYLVCGDGIATTLRQISNNGVSVGREPMQNITNLAVYLLSQLRA